MVDIYDDIREGTVCIREYKKFASNATTYNSTQLFVYETEKGVVVFRFLEF